MQTINPVIGVTIHIAATMITAVGQVSSGSMAAISTPAGFNIGKIVSCARAPKQLTPETLYFVCYTPYVETRTPYVYKAAVGGDVWCAVPELVATLPYKCVPTGVHVLFTWHCMGMACRS